LKIKLGSGLLTIIILAAILVFVIYVIPVIFLRIILGLPFVLLFPGYTLMVALFPRKESVGGIQLMALSFGLSIAIVLFISLWLNSTHWGIRLESILYSLFVFLVIISGIAWRRLRKIPPEMRRDFSFTINPPNLGQNRLSRALSIAMIILILGSLWTIGYVIARPMTGDELTEFYCLGINHQPKDYPTEFTLDDGQIVSVEYSNPSTVFSDQWGRLTLGIVNHEGKDTTYRVTIQVDGMQVGIPFQGRIVDEIIPITLTREEKWEQEIGIVPQHLGDNQKVEIFLYKEGGAKPYLNLNFWINVK